MRRSLLAHVFGSLQRIEVELECVGKHVSSDRCWPEGIRQELIELGRAVTTMRRTANRLNLELGAQNWLKARRSLEIFNGLYVLVRPEVTRVIRSYLQQALPQRSTRSGNELH